MSKGWWCVQKGGVCRRAACVGWHCVCRRIVRRRRVWCRGALRRRSAVCVEGLCAEEEGVCKTCVWRRVVCVCAGGAFACWIAVFVGVLYV